MWTLLNRGGQPIKVGDSILTPTGMMRVAHLHPAQQKMGPQSKIILEAAQGHRQVEVHPSTFGFKWVFKE